MVWKQEIREKAYKQFSSDYACDRAVFTSGKVITNSYDAIVQTRNYGEKGTFKGISTGQGAVLIAGETLSSWMKESFDQVPPSDIFKFPVLREINRKLEEEGEEIVDLHHCLLPTKEISVGTHSLDLQWITQVSELEVFRGDSRYSHALGFLPDMPDKMAVVAVEKGTIMGMAGVSADSSLLWQIGIDVHPDYRERGIGRILVGTMREKVLELGKIPFYGTCSSNVTSQCLALSTGFEPSWVEAYSKRIK